MLKREHGVLETEAIHGHPEIRLHIVRDSMIRVPWHRDNHGEWYSGVEGPPIKVSAIFCALDIAKQMRAGRGVLSGADDTDDTITPKAKT